jgi:hypothetical protein
VVGDAQSLHITMAIDAQKDIAHGATDKQKRTINNHVSRMLDCTIATQQEGCAGEKIVLAVYYFLELLTNAGLIELGAESPIAVLTEWLLSKIDADCPVTQKRIKNAQKDAVRWLSALREKGYYK